MGVDRKDRERQKEGENAICVKDAQYIEHTGIHAHIYGRIVLLKAL